jgi:hypothetical protein
MFSRSKEKLVISYVLLVGIPLLGVVGVLGAGRNLRAPTSIAGGWDFQINPSATQPQSCVTGLVVVRPTILDISQSGRYLTLMVDSQPKFSLEGTLQGKTIVANLSLPLEASCKGAAGLSLTAEIDSKTAPRIMSGVLSFDGCPSCGSANFQAVRHVLQGKPE